MRWLLLLLLMTASASAADPPITALAIAPDGRSVVVGSQAGVSVRSWPDLNLVRMIATELAHVHDLSFAPDGKALALAGGRPGDRGTVELVTWPAGTRTQSINLTRDVVYSVAWSSDANGIAAGSGDGNVYRVNVADGKHRALTGHSRGVLAVNFMPGDRELVSAGLDDSIRVWNAEAGSVTHTFQQHTKPVNGLALRPGTRPAEFASIGQDHTVRFWQPDRGRMIRFARLPSAAHALAWTVDGRAVVAACHDGRLRVVDYETAEVRADIAGVTGVAHSLAMTPDGSCVVAGEGGQVRVVRLNGRK